MYSVISYDAIKQINGYELVQNTHSSNGSIFKTESKGNFHSIESCKDFILNQHVNTVNEVDSALMVFTERGELLNTYIHAFNA